MSATYTTRGFHALAHDFGIASESREVGECLETPLSAFPEPEKVGSEYDVRVDGTQFVVELDGELEIAEGLLENVEPSDAAR